MHEWRFGSPAELEASLTEEQLDLLGRRMIHRLADTRDRLVTTISAAIAVAFSKEAADEWQRGREAQPLASESSDTASSVHGLAVSQLVADMALPRGYPTAVIPLALGETPPSFDWIRQRVAAKAGLH